MHEIPLKTHSNNLNGHFGHFEAFSFSLRSPFLCYGSISLVLEDEHESLNKLILGYMVMMLGTLGLLLMGGCYEALEANALTLDQL